MIGHYLGLIHCLQQSQHWTGVSSEPNAPKSDSFSWCSPGWKWAISFQQGVQGSSNLISFDQVVGILWCTLLSGVQSDPSHLCQVVHHEKFQSCVCNIFPIFGSISNISIARLWIGVLLMTKCTIKPLVALTGIPIEVADVSQCRVSHFWMGELIERELALIGSYLHICT